MSAPYSRAMAAEFKRNHIVTAGYLRSWAAADGRVAVQHLRGGTAHRSLPEKAGVRNGWWGDQSTAKGVETLLSDFESTALPTLQDPTAAWPLQLDRRRALALFLAVHVVRSPAYRERLKALVDKNVSDIRREFPAWAQAVPDHLHQYLSSRAFEVESSIGNITRIASVLSSMHATLMEANRPAVLTSDHPIAIVPLTLRPSAPVDAIPATGFLDVLEVRFPLNPRHVLLLSWHQDTDQPHPVRLTEQNLANCNRAVLAQAEYQAFHHPSWSPPIVAPPWQLGPVEPLAPRLLDGYNEEAARTSQRRLRASALVNDMIREDIHDSLRTVNVTRP